MINLQSSFSDFNETSNRFKSIIRGCHILLKNACIAQTHYQYIKKRISDLGINNFEVGYFPPAEYIDYILDFVSEEILQQTGILFIKEILNRGNIQKNYYNFFEKHNIIIPNYNEYGDIVSISGRTILSDDEMKENKIQKYKNAVYSKSLYLYGLHRAKKAIILNDCVYIVEGQIDCIACHNNGIYNCVAITGSSLSRYQFNLLLRLTNNLILILDNDVAGRKACNKIHKEYGKYCNIMEVKIPEEYNDVDIYLKKNSPNFASMITT